MSTLSFDFKVDFFDALVGEMAGGAFNGLPGYEPGMLAIDYSYRPAHPPWYIYGGGVRFEQEDMVAEEVNLTRETIFVSLYVEVASGTPLVTVRETDAAASAIGIRIGQILARRPNLVWPNSRVRIIGGQGDYEDTDQWVRSVLAYTVRTNTVFSLDVQ